VGTSSSQAQQMSANQQLVVDQLNNRVSSISGVSLDEESSNLLLYERSYQAAAKIISVVATLMGNVLDMGVTNPGY